MNYVPTLLRYVLAVVPSGSVSEEDNLCLPLQNLELLFRTVLTNSNLRNKSD